MIFQERVKDFVWYIKFLYQYHSVENKFYWWTLYISITCKRLYPKIKFFIKNQPGQHGLSDGITDM